jgi:predicted AAA+ superfamily ATPase
MDNIKEKHRKKIAFTSLEFIRSTMDTIDWNSRLIGIKGARGVGKTTLLLQYIKKHHPTDPAVLYASLDDIYFSDNTLIDFATSFEKQGGKRLFLDEVHKYPNWSQEIKNIYDDLPELQVVFTGSSLLEIINARADLSRRAIVYKMQGLSYREYLSLSLSIHFDVFKLEDILTQTTEITEIINHKIKPLQHFPNYLTNGYYPFFKESESLYHARITEVVNMIIELELPLLRGVDIAYTNKLKQLLYVIAQSVPFVPNISKLSERIGINRNTLISYLNYLQETGITRNLYKQASGITQLQKPEKIYLENSNLAGTFSIEKPNIGSIRETFLANQAGYQHQLTYPEKGDFLIDQKYLIEVGGSKKSNKQITGIQDSYIASDDIEFGYDNKIPLWLFGFLY